MTHEIDGFSIEPNSGSRFLFRRMAAPEHTYDIEITSERVTLVATLPAPVADGDPLVDAMRSKDKALKAADKHRRQMFGLEAPADAVMLATERKPPVVDRGPSGGNWAASRRAR
jgi:hypothetical protein